MRAWGQALGEAYALIYQGHIDRGLQRVRDALNLAEQAGDKLTAARCHALQGLGLYYRNRAQDSLLWSYNAVQMLERSDHPGDHAFSLVIAAAGQCELGDVNEAITQLSRAEDLLYSDTVIKEDLAFTAWLHMGLVHAEMHHYGHALEAVAQAGAVALDLPQSYQVEVSAQRAVISLRQAIEAYHLDPESADGQLQEALTTAVDAAEALQVAGSARSLLSILLHQGTGLGLLGFQAQAAHALWQSLELAESLQLTTSQYRLRLQLAQVARAAHNLPEAKMHLDAVRELGVDERVRSLHIDYHQELSAWHEASGDYQAALVAYRRFHRLSVEHLKARSDAQTQLLSVRMGTERTRLQAESLKLRTRNLERSVQSLTSQTEQLNEQAYRDPLTGLGNRRFFSDQMDELRSGATAYMIAVLDLDHFKNVNDVHGHAMGDRVLVEVGGILQQSCRPGDVVCRFGGEEFVVVLVGAGAEVGAMVADRLRRAIASWDWVGLHHDLAVTVSIGLAHGEPVDVDAAVAAADEALYEAKRAGRNRVHCADPSAARSTPAGQLAPQDTAVIDDAAEHSPTEHSPNEHSPTDSNAADQLLPKQPERTRDPSWRLGTPS